VLAWAAITIWGLAALKEKTLTQLSAWTEHHPALTTGGLLAAGLALVTVRVVNLYPLKAFPTSFNSAIVVLPGLLLVALTILAALIVSESFRTALDGLLRRVMTPLAGLWPAGEGGHSDASDAVNAERTLAWIGMALIGVVLLVSIAPRAFWDYPLGLDSSMHIYVGQHILRGGVPFRTVIVEYGPMRYIVSLLWSLGARLTGIPVVAFSRGADVAVSLGILLVSYAMGKRLTGRPLGGLIAASIMMGSELLDALLFGGPLFRLTTTLLMALAVLAGQHTRWFWAGLLAGIATMIYTPMMLLDLALLIAALLQSETPRWRALGYVVAGGGLIALGTLAGLAIFGLASDAYQLVIASVFSGLSGRYVTPGAGNSLGRIIRRLPWYGTVLRWNLRGDWEMIALMTAGVVTAFLPGNLRKTFRKPQIVVPLVTAVLMVISIVADEGGVSDTILRLIVLAPFGAWAVIAGLDALGGADRPRFLQVGQLAAIAFAVLVIGVADGDDQRGYLYSLVNIPLGEQQHVADELATAVEPGDTVMSTMNMWYQTLAEQDNALPIRRFGAKTEVLELTGWTPERALEALEADPPVVVMWVGNLPGDIKSWLQTEYDYMGYLDADSRFFEQKIYVLKGEQAIEDMIATWPLATDSP
jgi:hypothetical protein